MVVVVFRARLRSVVDEAKLEILGNRMAELAASMPGFISYKDFAAPDGENVTVVEFDTLENSAAWRDHPEHREAQQYGREHAFLDYRIQVCTLVREARFSEGDGKH